MYSPRSPINSGRRGNDGSTGNGISSNRNKRRLIRPSNLLPWSVDVVSAVPGPVSEILDTAITGAMHKKWACLAFPEGIFYVWQNSDPGGGSSSAMSSSNSGLGGVGGGVNNEINYHNSNNLLQRPKEYVKLILPDMKLTPEEGEENLHQQKHPLKPLVALTTPPGGDHDKNDSVQLYALNPKTGSLVLRKITRRDISTRTRVPVMTHTARTRIKLVESENDENGGEEEEERKSISSSVFFRSLMCYKSMIVATTSNSDLYWITHIAVPSSLHVQKVVAKEASGLFNYFFGSSGSSDNSSNTVGKYDDNIGGDVIVLPIPSDATTQFLAVSKSSGVIRWTTELPIANGHHANFTATQIDGGGSNNIFNDIITLASSSDDDWKVQEIIRSVLSDDTKFLHCIIRGKVVATNESRLYWVVARVEGISGTSTATEATVSIVRSHWLSRFAHPDQVRVLGLVSCENGNVYTALSVDGTVIVMALVSAGGGNSSSSSSNDNKNSSVREDDYIIQEVDLPREAPDLVPDMMQKDMVTYGCCMIATSGIGVRARFIMPQEQKRDLTTVGSPTKRPRLGNEGGLGQHLRSHFWTSYQDPTNDKTLPPSLDRAESIDLELAILHIGAELQQKGVPSSYSISIQWHKFFIKLIKEAGLYRRLSEDGKWKLFGIGQELQVFGEMSQLLLHHQEQQRYNRRGGNRLQQQQDDINDNTIVVVEEWQAGLQSHSIADWLLSVQESIERNGWSPHDTELWYDVLETALNTILLFREDHAKSTYDVISKRCSDPLWVSHPSMQEMLKRQIKYWERTKTYKNVPLELIELVVKTAVLSYSESLLSSSSSSSSSAEDRKLAFIQIRKSAISLLRAASDGRDDELAFELCKQYLYFDGLCQISVAHERRKDAITYSLDPLFNTIHGCDTESGWSFPQHVLQWHTDRGLYGQVINYGRHSVSDLNRIMNKNDKLRQFRWIPIIRQGLFSEATNMLLENCHDENNNGLRSNEWALSMAKLANQLVPSQNQQAQQHKREIERSLELIDAQKALTKPDDDDGWKEEKEDPPLMEPDELIELVMKKLEDTFDQDEKVSFAFIGLTVCNYIADQKISMDQTSRIWAECLLADGAQWMEWAVYSMGDDEKLRSDALSDTVFGRLLEECRKDLKSMSKVTYGRDIESVVIDRVQGDDHREEFTRVLRTVAAAPADSMQAESLLVSSF